MAVAGSFKVVLGSADEWPSDDSADIEGREQFSALLAKTVEVFESEMLFMAGNLEDTVCRSVEDGLASFDMLFAQSSNDVSARCVAITQVAGDT